ncbi:hypothetical protein [Streptomyces sp. NBC_01198]|uniref:hypothetical protein n=1 Tax=Streptomyces sp. NBC_01198 TaxID=2903769 RepID=UPI002E15FF4F|nr:hypothetical protein OG702_32985 [Streptomyces sp. NBC_01198]
MRLLPVVVILLAACAAAGCTTVSAPPSPAVHYPAPARPAPEVVPLTPPPARPLLATVRPGAGEDAADAATPGSTGPAPRHRPAAAAPHRPRPAGRRTPRARAPRVGRTPAGSGSGGVCALGRTYGGWAAGSAASTICARTYGS